jgi:hypothetical protein
MVQLGEILKAYGHFQEAALHLRHVLSLSLFSLRVSCRAFQKGSTML